MRVHGGRFVTYQDSALWKAALAHRDNDPYAAQRERLRVALESARRRVDPMVRQAHHDCFGLTIHDLTHLDALWEIGSQLISDVNAISPLEAFIFGASVLLHDTAMAISAYEGGIDALKATDTWERAVTTQLRSLGLPVLPRDIVSPDDTIVRSATFSVLRTIHAKQAALLAEREWLDPVSKSKFYIFDDSELRSFYGQMIGRIAYSHHWNIEKVEQEFPAEAGINPEFPSDWHLSPLRVACLLRCSDAAHIDRRRAPTMDYALMAPSGLSELHWRFQNHLAVPRIVDRKMLFSSGRDFGRSEADAWWLCFDTCRMISRELEQCDALLQEAGIPRFTARSVEGVIRPKLFAVHVKCSGWEPVDAEIRVSDPIALARTLGGENLYGGGYHAPIREMLQNSIDATKLRVTAGSSDYRPLIRVTLDRTTSGSHTLKIEDNGIGMSERVLTSALIDFGKSMWNNESMIDEYPGIKPTSVKSSGKFGIGFFSTFLLGDRISVFSKRFDKGTSDIKVLDFVGLSRRPILRRAEQNEFNEIFNTQVLIHLSDSLINTGFSPAPSDDDDNNDQWDFFKFCSYLAISAPVDIDFVDNLGARSFFHKGAWVERPSEEFLADLYFNSDDDSDNDEAVTLLYTDMLSDVVDEEGIVVGRAAISLTERRRLPQRRAKLSVGGLTYEARNIAKLDNSSTSNVPDYIGILAGNATIATRSTANVAISPATLAKWATKQANLASNSAFSLSEKIKVAREVYWAGGDTGDLPIGILKGKNANLSEVKKFLQTNSELYLILERNRLLYATFDSVYYRYFLDKPDIPIFISESGGRPIRVGSLNDKDEDDLELTERSSIVDLGIYNFSYGQYDIVADIILRMGAELKVYGEGRKPFVGGKLQRSRDHFIVFTWK